MKTQDFTISYKDDGETIHFNGKIGTIQRNYIKEEPETFKIDNIESEKSANPNNAAVRLETSGIDRTSIRSMGLYDDMIKWHIHG